MKSIGIGGVILIGAVIWLLLRNNKAQASSGTTQQALSSFNALNPTVPITQNFTKTVQIFPS